MNTERFIFAVGIAIGMVSFENSDLFRWWAAQRIDFNYAKPDFSAPNKSLKNGI